MVTATHAIVLSKLKYGDNDLIIKCYTAQFGVVSFLLKHVLKRKKAKIKPAYFQLLSQLQLDVNYKENRSLQTISDVKINYHYSSLHTNIYKSAIGMFLAEVLAVSLYEEEQNEILYQYIETSLQWLDVESEYANFHLLFLIKLTRHLGFYPEHNNKALPFFNLQSGHFETSYTNRYSISDGNLILLNRLLGTGFDDLLEIKMSSNQRQGFLNMLLLYFELHLGRFRKPKSLEIFNQVFSG